MGNANIKSKQVTRDKLSRMAGGNLELIKLFENLISDVTGFEAFPVGSVFTSVVDTDPSQLLGYGVWSSYAAGQVLVGVAPGDPDFGTPGGTGGAKTAAIDAHAGAAVADHVDHTHDVTSNVTATTANSFGAGATPAATSITNGTVTSTGASTVLAHTVTQPSDHADVSVVQPFVTVYFWRRTA